MPGAKILLVSTQKTTKEFLKKIGNTYTLLTTESLSSALNILLRDNISVIIVDWEESYLERIKGLLNYSQETEIIILSQEKPSLDLLTLASIYKFSFLNNEEFSEILKLIENILNKNFLKNENKKLYERIEARYIWGDFTGRGNYYNLIIGKIEECCRVKSPVLITGEAGTEKDIIAYEIYKNSRSSGNFIKINIQSDTLEDISFIYKAHNGCLVIDDIGLLNLEEQKKLKGLLEEQITSYRLILFSSQDLAEKVKKGEFDQVLFSQISAYQIDLIPLRERIRDLPDILDNYLTIINETNNFAISGIEDDALILLSKYSWPGNTAQLRSVFSLICYAKRQGQITLRDMPLALRGLEPQVLAAELEKYSRKKF